MVARCWAASAMHTRGAQRGFAMLALMILVALMGLALASASTIWSTQSKRDKEAELLRIGMEFKAAILSYAKNSPGTPEYPRSLQDLVQDPRFPTIKRHLRRIYADPFTGKADWGLIKLGDSIVGVHSLAPGKPLKVANLGEDVVSTDEPKSYADWKFAVRPDEGGAVPGANVSGGINRPPGSPLTDPAATPQPSVEGNPGGTPRPVEGNPGGTTAPVEEKAQCQEALAEAYKRCAQIPEPQERGACLQAAIIAHQNCLQPQ